MTQLRQARSDADRAAAGLQREREDLTATEGRLATREEELRLVKASIEGASQAVS